MLWADVQNFRSDFPGFALLLMATKESQAEKPNLPLVSVRGILDSDMWALYERYNIQYTPPTANERLLAQVIVALEELVESQEATITHLRKRE